MDTTFAMDGKLYMYIVVITIYIFKKSTRAHFLSVVVISMYLAAALSYDDQCGSTKGCFTNCKADDSLPCDFLVTWQNTSSGSLKFTLNATTNREYYYSYLAVAFSEDYRMGDDSVVACYWDGPMVAQPSYNSGTDNDRISTTGLIYNVSGHLSYSEMDCEFKRQLSTSESRFFDLNNDYYIMLVTGRKTYTKNRYALEKHEGLPWLSDSKVDFQSYKVVGPYILFSPLVKLHGSMMILAWVLFSWIGIMTARYNKDMLPEKKLFGTKVWFQVHRMLMVAVLLCVVVGFIAIFVEIGGYSQVTPDEKKYMGAHPVLGIIITLLVFLNPIGALFRPEGDHKFRWIFNWGHLGIGVIEQLLAVITIFIGYFSNRVDVSDAPAYVTASHLFIIIFVSVFLEVRKRTFVGKQDSGTANYVGTKVDVTPKPKDETTKPDNGPFIALVVFSIFTAGIVVALLFILALS